MITDIIDETFVFSADYDYLNARWLIINGLYRPFFWPALHAIEKYLKANLLYLGVPVNGKKFGHNIKYMASVLAKKDPILKNIDLVPKKEHENLEKYGCKWGSSKIDDFLDTIDKYGDPGNRYDYYGSEYEYSYLLKLDHVVYSLRSNVTNIKWLHKVRNLDQLSFFAYEQNYYFAPVDYKHKDISCILKRNLSVPTIELAVKGSFGYQYEFEQWLTRNIRISDKDIEKIKNM